MLKEQQNIGEVYPYRKIFTGNSFPSESRERIQRDLRKALPGPRYQCDSGLKNSSSIDCFISAFPVYNITPSAAD